MHTCTGFHQIGTGVSVSDHSLLLSQVGGVLGALVSAGVLPLKEVATATLEAAVEEEGQDGQLVDGRSAWKLMGGVLQAVAQHSNQGHMRHVWKDTGLQLDPFFPSVRATACVSSNTGHANTQRGQAATYFLFHKVPDM